MTQDPPRMISVLRDSHDCVGFLRSAGPRGFQAYDAAGQPLGLFQDNQAAIEAITAAMTNAAQAVRFQSVQKTGRCEL